MKEKTEKKLTDNQRRALTRAFALRAEGKPWKQIAKAMEDEGFINSEGNLYTDDCLRGWYSKLKGQIPTADNHTDKVDTVDTVEEADMVDSPVTSVTVDNGLSPRDEHVIVANVDIVDKLDRPESSPVPDTVTREELIAMMAALEDRLTNLIDAKLKDQVASSGRAVTVDNVDEPPLPPRTGPAGKKFAGSKGDIRVRCDSVLVSLFERFAEQHFGGNLSRAMDAALWHFFAKPALSFEQDLKSDN